MPHVSSAAVEPQPVTGQPVSIEFDRGVTLSGQLDLPTPDAAPVILAFASATSRHRPPNRRMAASLQHMGFGTLLLDLLADDEGRENTRESALVFHIDLLADRLAAATRWLRSHLQIPDRPVGYFSTSTGAAAALMAAARNPALVQAVACGSGRVDLAGLALGHVTAPTLLIVSERDAATAEFNRAAYGHLRCPKHLEIVYGTARLFDTPYTIERVEQAAAAWFGWFLQQPRDEAEA